jgi:hypothetical protein
MTGATKREIGGFILACIYGIITYIIIALWQMP